MQIDSHQHFWQYSRADYPWIGPESQLLAQDYLPVDLEPHVRGEGIGGTVAVQARQTLEESRWLLELAATHPLIQGVVGWVDLNSTENIFPSLISALKFSTFISITVLFFIIYKRVTQ